MVEYLPVEFTEAGEDGRVFAKNLTQFYFRCVLQIAGGCAGCSAIWWLV
jgi:hypothetical protein